MKLCDMKIGMLGFGAQGKAEATNLMRSKVPFCLGLRQDGKSWQKAKDLGFSPVTINEACEKSEILLINLSDESQQKVYEEIISKTKVRYLIFAHGFSTSFKKIPVTKEGPRHVLIAPKGAASGLENLYGTPEALPAILAFESYQNKTPTAEEKEWIEELAISLGANKNFLIWAGFRDETVCDLFSEQALLCGGVSELLKTAYEVLTEAGYSEETAYFETLFELKLIVDLIWKEGISGMRSRISPTARYGDLTRGKRIIDASTKTKMKEVLSEIESGQFAKEFLENIHSKQFQKTIETEAQHPIEIIGKRLRSHSSSK